MKTFSQSLPFSATLETNNRVAGRSSAALAMALFRDSPMGSSTMLERTAKELLDDLHQQKITSHQILEFSLQAIQKNDSKIQAFLALDPEGARAQAEAVDLRRMKGEPVGLLAGLPLALKDILCVRGWQTSCGSKILEDFRPPYDAHVVTRLKEADAILLGRTNMDEFAMGSSTENSAFQVTRNPWNTDHIPGGSSGGSAAAVAVGEVPLALGTDTGGSIRQPAGFCGVVGLKPTYGRVSRYGLIAYASSLDQIGPIARTVTDAALLLQAIAGHDPRDSTSVNRNVPTYTESIDQPVKPLTIGVPTEYFKEGLSPEVETAVREALNVYRSQGATIKEVSLPHTKYGVATYYLVATAEASSNLARYEGSHYGYRAEDATDLIDTGRKTRGQGFGPEVKRRIMLGTFALSSGYIDAYYLKALKIRRLIKDDFDRAFAECDVIAGPTSPTPAFRVGERVNDPLAMYLSDIYTISANLSGIPAISIPCGFTKAKLPVGLQLQAPPFEEEKLLRIARMYEKQTEWHQQRPDLATTG